MYRALVFQIFLLAIIIICPYPALAKQAKEVASTPSYPQQYTEAKFYFKQLQSNEKLAASRKNWLNGTQNFKNILHASPRSAVAPACLFVLGRMYLEMFARFEKQVDVEQSISYYKKSFTDFPAHRLADDSQYALGKIYLNQLKDPKTASTWFRSVISQYPDGDMNRSASEQLKGLSRDHAIPLPNDMVGGTQLDNLNYVLPVKFWSSENYSRVVIMASGPVQYSEILLEPTKNKPRRLSIDFHDCYIEPQYRAPIPVDDGLLKQVRTGQFTTDTVRVVLDIESISNYKIFSLPDPFRVVVDVRGNKQPVFDVKRIDSPKLSYSFPPPTIVLLEDCKKKAISAKSSGKIVKGAQPSKTTLSPETKKSFTIPTAEKDLTIAQQLGLGVRSIILDPGHGGKDPGAMANGLKEKDIVLDVAKKLAPLLEKNLGCKVTFTRDNDTFIPLEDRTAIANTQGADLFISLHINAHTSKDIKGIETYYLNFSTNAEAMRVAARENATSAHQLSDLQDILASIMKNSKINESSRLAEYVHSSIVTNTVDKDFFKIRNLGVKQAPFYVLIGAEMPAILVEIAFISNKDDASNLTNVKFINKVAAQISNGIGAYINSTTAAL